MLLVVLFLLICVTPAAFLMLPLLVLYALPLGVLLWIWRSGTDVDADGITVRAIAGSRRVSWNDIAGLSPTGRGDLRAVLADGRLLRLPQARLRHLTVIAAASGGRVSADS
jgi:PH (Pleckstrin Homology) domain-containing protein